jgi:hypothetical protein
MYKIYINETPLYLTTVQEAQELGPASDKILVLHYPGKKKFLLNVTDQLEKSDRFERVVVFSKNLEKLWSDFQSAFKLIGAAGGAVFNDGKVLMIFRREHWDLPKGKIDDGETPEPPPTRTWPAPDRHLAYLRNERRPNPENNVLVFDENQPNYPDATARRGHQNRRMDRPGRFFRKTGKGVRQHP